MEKHEEYKDKKGHHDWGHDDKKHKHDDDCDDDDKHEHGHKKPGDKPKPVEPSCSVESVRVFGSSAKETLYPKTIKVPVTLAEPSVIVCVEADIRLEKPALEIKRVLKSVILEQCELVNTFDPLHAKLFVSGFIRKNIEYATVDHASDKAVCGDIRHTTVLVPFHFCTDITFPLGGPSLQLAPDFTSSGQLLDKSGHGAQVQTALLGNRIFYNNKPYCQLVYSEFTELDIGQNLQTVNGYEHSFTLLREKIVLRLGLKVLQDQQVPLPTTPPPAPPPYICKK